MPSQSSGAVWDFQSALELIKRLSATEDDSITRSTSEAVESLPAVLKDRFDSTNKEALPGNIGLGDFSNLWKYLQDPVSASDGGGHTDNDTTEVDFVVGLELDAAQLAKGVRWRDEFHGADLEDNVEPSPQSASYIRNQKRAKRRHRAKERAELLPDNQFATTTDDAESDDNDLESLRRSPDRRALVASIIGRPLPLKRSEPLSPPTSPSPPKAEQRSRLPQYPVSNPFLWSVPDIPSPRKKITIKPLDEFTASVRKSKLIQNLSKDFPEARRYLSNSGLKEPAFSRLNKSDIGVHVFIDMSNISIGFHDCLKQRRDIPISTRIRRVPMNFHNLSLVLERGRPAARRALAGSDKTAAIVEAESLGYEINILERVHKAKQLTPKQKKYMNRASGNGNTSASGYGETSGSETNPGYLTSQTLFSTHQAASAVAAANGFMPSKWVEQGVDEILHLKILESVIDAKSPSTIVLATGDAAEAEYSAGFLKMVERALDKGWVVELVSFRLNTSSAYTRASFRSRWGSMFRWITLDDYVEYLIQDTISRGEEGEVEGH